MTLKTILCAFFYLYAVSPMLAQEPVDTTAISFIRQQGLEYSQVMAVAGQLTDVFGPRLTNSPNTDQAGDWAMEQLRTWGLQRVHRELWGPFGRGWSYDRFSLHVTAPTPFPVLAYPKAWSPDTGGPLTGTVIHLNAENEADLEAYRGQLAGKFVLLDPIQEAGPDFEATARRRDAEELLKLANAGKPGRSSRSYSEEAMARYRFNQYKMLFLYAEQPAALLSRSGRGDEGAVFVQAADVPLVAEGDGYVQARAWDVDMAVLPQATLGAEDYNRILRLLDRGLPVSLAMNLSAVYHETDLMGANLLAELPGTDPNLGQEVVMLGAHFDSWHAGTGATDNAAGVAVMMEAMRILKATFDSLDTAPRRTIRVALWGGEEQGLLGSRAYVNTHFAELGDWGQPPLTLKPGHEKLSAYYNLDNGTGKIRGIHLQGNEAAGPIFRDWLRPFADLEASTVSLANTGGTDHLPFDDAGLPGFQFIQDHIAYGTRTHHSSLDVYDQLMPDDLKQAAMVIASFAYHTAQRDEKIPRKAPVEGSGAGTR